MQRRVAVIVEGHGERETVPLLVRRIHGVAHDLVLPDIRAQDVIRMARSKLVREGELERGVELAARKVGSDGAILILLDADDDLPCELGPRLLARAQQRRPGMRIGVVVANREFEAWFLATATALGIGDQDCERAAESPRDAKGKIRAALGRYSPVLDQPKLAAKMDLAQARENAPSFDKMWRVVSRLLAIDA